MVEPFRIDCNLDTILFYALARLIQQGVCTTTNGFIGQQPDRNLIQPSINYYTVKAGKQNLVNAECKAWAGQIMVRQWANSVVDIASQDNISLTQNAGNGLQAMNNRVIAALDLWDMNNGAYYFLAQPMRFADQSEPVRDNDRASSFFNWSYCDLWFDILYGEDATFVSPQVNGVDEFTFEFTQSFL